MYRFNWVRKEYNDEKLSFFSYQDKDNGEKKSYRFNFVNDHDGVDRPNKNIIYASRADIYNLLYKLLASRVESRIGERRSKRSRYS